MKRLLMAIPFSLALAGCGTDGDEFYAAVKGTLSKAQATARQSALTTAVKIDFGKPGEMTATTRSREESIYAGCTTNTPTTTEDADGDSIPKTKTSVTKCNNIVQNGYTYNQNGSFTITDKDDTKKEGGFRYEYTDYDGGHTSSSGTEKYSFNGFFDLTRNGGSWAYESNWQGKGENTSTTRASSTKYTYGSRWKNSIVPTDAASPFAAGVVNIDGFYGYKQEGSGTHAGQPVESFEYVLKVVSTGLKYQTTPACTNYYKEGEISFTDASGNVLKYVYTCSTVTRTYNGEAL